MFSLSHFASQALDVFCCLLKVVPTALLETLISELSTLLHDHDVVVSDRNVLALHGVVADVLVVLDVLLYHQAQVLYLFYWLSSWRWHLRLLFLSLFRWLQSRFFQLSI